MSSGSERSDLAIPAAQRPATVRPAGYAGPTTGVPLLRRTTVSALLLCALGWAAATRAGDPSISPGLGPSGAALAPGPAEWDVALVEAESRIARAENLASAAQRLQNAWATALDGTSRPCDAPELRDLGARIVPFAHAWRDAVQDARVQADRVVRLRDEVTVAPLLDEDASARVDGLTGRVAHQVRAWSEYRAWHERHAGTVATCGAPVVAGGLASPRPWQPPVAAPTAVLGIGGGTVCPENVPADGRVVLVAGNACWSAGPCDCSPGPVHPGAVLGPAPPPVATEVPPAVERIPTVGTSPE